MKRKLLIGFLVMILAYFFIVNMGTKPAFAATHIHTDDCYNGTLHVHAGNSTSGGSCYGGIVNHIHLGNSYSYGGCYGGINYHYHFGSSSSGGGCYGTPVYHVHTGNLTSGGGCYSLPIYHSHTGSSTSGGGCYGAPIYHSHTGGSTSGGGCYGTPVYHSHTGSSTSGGGCYGTINYHSHTGSSTSGGGCYGTINYHSHSGSSTSGGGCYGTINYHAHSGSSTSGGGCYGTINYHVHSGSVRYGGGCYGKANYHSHVSGCYGTCNAIIGSNGICPSCGGANMPGYHCPRQVLKCGMTTSTIVNYSITCGKTTSTIVSYSMNCGKTTSTIESYSRNCGKTTSTIESYSRNCGKSTSTIESYSRNCGMTTTTITGYALNCGMTPTTITGYSLNCGKTPSTIVGYNLGCGKTTSTIESYALSCGKSTGYIESYYLNCGKTTSTIDGYYINCDKTAGYYYNGSTQVSPICNTVVTSISPTNPTQTISQGGMIVTTATATYLDGSTGIVSCTATGFDTNIQGNQTVTLTYSGLVGNAKTTGTRTCTMSVTVKVISVSAVVTNSINSIKLDASVIDAISGLAAYPYRYTIGGITTDWLTSNSYTKYGLIPNTSYDYTVEVKGIAGHISKTTGTTYTKADTPSTTAKLLEGGKVQVLVTDTNPEGTKYRVKVGSQYADFNGNLSSTESWFLLTKDITLGGRMLLLPGLSQNTPYTIAVSAKDNFNGEISIGNSVTIATPPGFPTDLTISSVTSSDITLNWSSVSGAVSYELKRKTLAPGGEVTAEKSIIDLNANNYIDRDVSSDQKYSYTIRCKNQYGIYGSWSQCLEVKTLPTPPAQVTNVVATVEGSDLSITWNFIEGVIGYKVVIKYDGITVEKYSTTNQTSYNTKYDCQCDITVQAFNVWNLNSPEDTSKWSNGGLASVKVSCHTEANVPVMDLTVQNIRPNSVNVIWSAIGNPASVTYKLGIFKDGVNVMERDRIAAPTMPEGYKVDGLEPETTYTLKVKAVNSIGVETEWSNAIIVTTLIDYPGIPSGLRASSKANSVKLYWNSAARAQKYEIREGTEIIAAIVVPESSALNEYSYQITGLTPETSYTYCIYAINAAGEGNSQPLTVKTKGFTPSAPVVSAVTGSSISITIDWSPVEGADSYEIESDGTVDNIGSVISYTHSGLLPGSYHSYRVRARNSNGGGDWSDYIRFTTIPAIPGIPGYIAINTSDTQMIISWNKASDALTYDVEIDGVVYYGIAALEYQYTFQGESLSSTEHAVRVRSVNGGGSGGWSEICTAVMTEGGTLTLEPVPSTPTPICSVSGSAIVVVSWNEVEGASKYLLEADNTIVYEGPCTSYTFTGMAESSQHQYRVSAGNLSGYSNWSNPVIATTNAMNTTTPNNITYFRENDTLITVTWDGVAGATGYRIEVNGAISENIINDIKTSITTAPGVQYDIRIASIIQSGETELLDWSDVITFRTPNKLPLAPIIESITATSNTVSLAWGAIADAVGYEIEADGQVSDIRNILNYDITNLESSSSHTVRIRAYNEAGRGDWSNNKTIMTNEGLPGVPVNITADPVEDVNAVTGSAIQIKWDSLEEAVSYEVEDGNGNIYQTEVNKITIHDLMPGESYTFRIRAVTVEGAGAWSSRISVVSIVLSPMNVSAKAEDGVVRISWDKVGGAQFYEIDLDGVTVATTEGTSYDFDYDTFFVKRTIRIRACNGTQKSEWSQAVIYDQALPITVELSENEEISVLLPVSNADLDKYKLTLTYNPEELVLIDSFEVTPEAEVLSIYIEEYDTYIILGMTDGMRSITFLVQDDGDSYFTGTVSSIRFRSLITGKVTLYYGVTEK